MHYKSNLHSLLTIGEPPWNFRKKFRSETLKNEVFRKSILTPPSVPLDPPLGGPTVPIYVILCPLCIATPLWHERSELEFVTLTFDWVMLCEVYLGLGLAPDIWGTWGELISAESSGMWGECVGIFIWKFQKWEFGGGPTYGTPGFIYFSSSLTPRFTFSFSNSATRGILSTAIQKTWYRQGKQFSK